MGQPFRPDTLLAMAAPVRITVDLAPEEHTALRRWRAAAADELGVLNVSAAVTVRALVGLVQGHPALSAQLVQEIGRRLREDGRLPQAAPDAAEDTGTGEPTASSPPRG